MAMSGGVDSSAACVMLQDRDYDVTGVTLRLLDNERTDNEIADARSVCKMLGIRHIVVNVEDLFDREVVRRFCRSYLSGDTPNPCIDCNKLLKFGYLNGYRRDNGFDYISTGHYAQVALDEGTGRWNLLCAIDANKDQSYFLYNLKQDELSHTVFPLGEINKDEARAVAISRDLLTAHKSDSQDICFIEDGSYASFIKGYLADACEGTSCAADGLFAEGEIVDLDNNVLGRHCGLANYTLGQRRGIGVASSEPLYVYKKDVEGNRLVVGHAGEILVNHIVANDINLISADSIEGEIPVKIKAHYRQIPKKATAKQIEDKIHVFLDDPIPVCSPGQALVLYDGYKVVGGGTIVASDME